MTSTEDARTFCEEAIAQSFRQFAGVAGKAPTGQEYARAVLDLLFGTPDTPCPECGGRGIVPDPEGFENDASEVIKLPCLACHGTGGTTGKPPLRRPCPTCGGQRGWITVEHLRAADNDWDEVEVPHPCPDCTDGFSLLAAIDEARGAEVVLSPATSGTVRFPAPDWTSQ